MRTVLGSHPRVNGRTGFDRLAGDMEALASLFKPAGTLVGINLVGEKRMSMMNRVYKGRRGCAEILTFDYRTEGQGGHGGDDPSGEIYLCWKRLSASAARKNVTHRAYALRLLAHGLCHLQGHSHGDDVSAGRMEKAEIRYLEGFLTAGEIDRLFDRPKRNG